VADPLPGHRHAHRRHRNAHAPVLIRP
jgi:hypothetical protein